MPESRRLAAVMFSDICGYTTMMGDDESKALAVLERNKFIHIKSIEKYEGHYIKEIGDGTLAWFESSSTAVECALEILEAATEEGYSLRFGIHEGDIVMHPADIFGSGVNVAARIEAAAPPGSILFSSKVYDSLRNQTHFECVRIGRYNLKNDDQSREFYALANPPCYVPLPSEIRTPRTGYLNSRSGLVAMLVSLAVILGLLAIWYTDKPLPSRDAEDIVLAILPFESAPGSESDISPGALAAAVSERMSTVKGLTTIPASRTTESSEFVAEASVGGIIDLSELAAGISATHFLKGVVSDELLIELIDCDDQSTVWSRHFSLGDPLTTFASIRRNVLRELGLSSDNSDSPADHRMTDEAMNLYLEALELWYRRANDSNIYAAVKLLKEAELSEPDNPDVLGLTALCYATGTDREFFSFDTSQYLILDYGERTLDLDPDHPHGLLAMGTYFFAKRDFELAEQYYLRAFNAAPAFGITSQALGELALFTGDYSGAYRYIKLALKAAPHDVVVLQHMGHAEMANGYPKTAKEYYAKIARTFPDLADDKYYKVFDFIIQDEYQAALNILYNNSENRSDNSSIAEGFVLTEMGDADRYLEYSNTTDTTSYVGKHIHMFWNLQYGSPTGKEMARDTFRALLDRKQMFFLWSVQTYPFKFFNTFRTDSEIQDIASTYGITMSPHPYFKMREQFDEE